MTKLTNPRQLFYSVRGTLLDGGRVYVGEALANPKAVPVALYWDKERTIPAAQPLRTLGGRITNNGQPGFIFLAEDDYSLLIEDEDGTQVEYIRSTYEDDAEYQPLDTDLSAIAALTTTAFGRGLLTLANQAALAAATGIPAPIPAAGGTVTGNIVRGSAGAHLYHTNAAYASGRVFGPEHTTDPTSLPGDIWFKPDA